MISRRAVLAAAASAVLPAAAIPRPPVGAFRSAFFIEGLVLDDLPEPTFSIDLAAQADATVHAIWCDGKLMWSSPS